MATISGNIVGRGGNFGFVYKKVADKSCVGDGERLTLNKEIFGLFLR